MLVNAVYFKALFARAFKQDKTVEASFFKYPRTVKEEDEEEEEEEEEEQKTANVGRCLLMHQENVFPYYQDDAVQACILHYGTPRGKEGVKGPLSAVVILPKEKGAHAMQKVVGSLGSSWASWEFKDSQGSLYLPKFKFETSQSLNTILQGKQKRKK